MVQTISAFFLKYTNTNTNTNKVPYQRSRMEVVVSTDRMRWNIGTVNVKRFTVSVQHDAIGVAPPLDAELVVDGCASDNSAPFSHPRRFLVD